MNAAVRKIVNPSPTAIDVGLLILRVGFGGMMAYGHGWEKLEKYHSTPSTFPLDPLNIGSSLSFFGAVGAEFFCAILVTIGLATRAACVPLLFAMGVAFFKVHGGKLGFVPAPGASEPALVYILAFLVILLCGPGRFSLDQTFFGGKGGKG